VNCIRTCVIDNFLGLTFFVYLKPLRNTSFKALEKLTDFMISFA